MDYFVFYNIAVLGIEGIAIKMWMTRAENASEAIINLQQHCDNDLHRTMVGFDILKRFNPDAAMIKQMRP